MPNKSLGRGLDQISEMFLSQPENSAKSQDTTLPSDAGQVTCHTCRHFISICSDPTCRIFTFDNERYNVPYRHTIDPYCAAVCNYYCCNTIKSMTGPQECKISGALLHTQIMKEKKSLGQKQIKETLITYIAKGFDVTQVVLEKTEEHDKCTHKEKKTIKVVLSAQK